MSGRASAETAPKVHQLADGRRLLLIWDHFELSVLRKSLWFISGTSWTEVDSPSPDVSATHVAVGINVVWALTKDNKVRKFLSNDNTTKNEY